MGVRLPAEYQEVEYLEGTGTQYIDTGFSPTIETEVVIDFSDFDNNGNTYATPFGFALNGSHVGTYKQNNNRAVYTSFGSSVDVSYDTPYGWKNRLVISQSKNGVFENNTRVVSAYENLTFTETSQHIFVFARSDSGGTAARFVICKLYKLQINDDTIQVRNYIPCYRKSDSKPGMYDLVSETFFVNQGTGEFLVGPDIKYGLPYEYQEVEYLKGANAQYIDTGVMLTSDAVVTVSGVAIAPILVTGFKSMVFGTFETLNSGAKRFGAYGADHDLYMYFGDYRTQGHVTTVLKGQSNKYTVIFDKYGIHYNGNLIAQTVDPTEVFETSTSLYLFGGHSGSSGLFNPGSSALSEVLIQDGTLQRHYIPCYRKSDNEPGMYDLVSGTFFTNQGTGEFTVGPDIHRTISSRLMDRRRALIAKLTSLFRKVITSQTGLVSFDTNVAKPMKVTCEFSPKQDLHGYDNPWPAGGGANRFDEVWESGSFNGNTGEPTVNTAWSRSVNFIPVQAETQYYIYVADVSDTEYFYLFCYKSDNTYISAIYVGENRIVTTPAECAYMKVEYKRPIADVVNYKVAINYPSSVTTYSPYSNICPISGHTGLTVTRTGENLADMSTVVTGGYYNGDGAWLTSAGSATTALIPVKPNTTYVSSLFDLSGVYVFRCVATLWDDENTCTGQRTSGKITTGSNTKFVRLRNFDGQSSYVQNNNYLFQLELGSTHTEYAAYKPIAILPIPFNNPGTYDFLPIQEGTGDPSPENVRPITPGLTFIRDDDSVLSVYGGTLTVNADGTGSLVSNYRIEDVKANANSYSINDCRVTGDKYFERNFSASEYAESTVNIEQTAIQKEKFSCGMIANPWASDNNGYNCSWVLQNKVRVGSFGHNNIDSWKAYLAELDSVGILYPLATPVTYTLSVAETSRAFEALGLGKNLGPLYDGTVTLNDDGSCDVVVDYWFQEFTGEEAWYDNTVSGNKKYFLAQTIPVQPVGGIVRDVKSSIAKYNANLGAGFDIPGYCMAYGFVAAKGWVGYCFDPDDIPTVEDFKSFLAELYANGTPAQFYAKLRTTQTYHFSSICELQSFLGINNVWSDLNGPITIEYYKKQL